MSVGLVQVEPLLRLLTVFVDGDRSERLALVRLQGQARSYFSDALESSGRLMAAGIETHRAHASIATLMRLIWSLVPPRLLEAQSPDYRGLATRALTDRFGDFTGLDDAVRYLTTVFKRIRQYAKVGRQATSFDLERVAHRQLLESQAGRCAHCLHEFKADNYHYAAEDDGVPGERESRVEGELSLATMLRRPQLDHIIPLILGGDMASNWQILCTSCNLGKSDQVSYLGSVSGRAYNRVGQMLDLTPAMRYAVIAEAPSNQAVAPGDSKCFRVFKIQTAGFANLENLEARYC